MLKYFLHSNYKVKKKINGGNRDWQIIIIIIIIKYANGSKSIKEKKY
jgi:hypothetical protein